MSSLISNPINYALSLPEILSNIISFTDLTTAQNISQVDKKRKEMMKQIEDIIRCQELGKMHQIMSSIPGLKERGLNVKPLIYQKGNIHLWNFTEEKAELVENPKELKYPWFLNISKDWAALVFDRKKKNIILCQHANCLYSLEKGLLNSKPQRHSIIKQSDPKWITKNFWEYFILNEIQYGDQKCNDTLSKEALIDQSILLAKKALEQSPCKNWHIYQEHGDMEGSLALWTFHKNDPHRPYRLLFTLKDKIIPYDLAKSIYKLIVEFTLDPKTNGLEDYRLRFVLKDKEDGLCHYTYNGRLLCDEQGALLTGKSDHQNVIEAYPQYAVIQLGNKVFEILTEDSDPENLINSQFLKPYSTKKLASWDIESGWTIHQNPSKWFKISLKEILNVNEDSKREYIEKLIKAISSEERRFYFVLEKDLKCRNEGTKKSDKAIQFSLHMIKNFSQEPREIGVFDILGNKIETPPILKMHEKGVKEILSAISSLQKSKSVEYYFNLTTKGEILYKNIRLCLNGNYIKAKNLQEIQIVYYKACLDSKPGCIILLLKNRLIFLSNISASGIQNLSSEPYYLAMEFKNAYVEGLLAYKSYLKIDPNRNLAFYFNDLEKYEKNFKMNLFKNYNELINLGIDESWKMEIRTFQRSRLFALNVQHNNPFLGFAGKFIGPQKQIVFFRQNLLMNTCETFTKEPEMESMQFIDGFF